MKLKSFVLIITITVLIIISTACNRAYQQYEFPLKEEDVEKVIDDLNLNWYIDDVSYYDNNAGVTGNIITMKNKDNVMLALNTALRENGKSMAINWVLPKEYTDIQFNDFYIIETPEIFNLIANLYGNSKLINGLGEFTHYYESNDGNFEGGLYWTKRIGNYDHIRLQLKPWLNSQDDNRNRVGSILITNLYEDYLKANFEGLKNTARDNDLIELSESTVEGLISYTPSDYNNFYSKQFIINGHLEDIREIKEKPDSLKYSESNILMPNIDKYYTAKLIDNTGEIEVILVSTSLNKVELKIERNHHILLCYYANNPFYVVRSSVLK